MHIYILCVYLYVYYIYIHAFLPQPTSTTSIPRSVVQWWVLAFAIAKLGMALGDFVVAIMYFNQTLGVGFGCHNPSHGMIMI